MHGTLLNHLKMDNQTCPDNFELLVMRILQKENAKHANKYAGDAGLSKIGVLRSLYQDNVKKGRR